jgi:outer membrane protein TolC
MFGGRISAVAGSLLLNLFLLGCAVGPDFKPVAPPDTTTYSKEPLPSHTASANIAGGRSQRFVRDLDIPAEWWTLFRSRKLNALIERSLKSNPTLEAALGALRQAQENVHVQEGKFFPLVQGNFNPTRQQVPNTLTSPLSSGASIFDIVTTQVIVSYTFDVWGQNRRAVESLRAQADSQRFLLEAARLTLTSNSPDTHLQCGACRNPGGVAAGTDRCYSRINQRHHKNADNAAMATICQRSSRII